MSGRVRVIARSVLLIGTWPLCAGAQSTAGQILGAVNDTTRSPIVAARIDVIEDGSGRLWHVMSDAPAPIRFRRSPRALIKSPRVTQR